MKVQATMLALLVTAVATDAAAQGLGDAAAREKQRRAKGGTKSTAVVTEKDLAKYAGDRPEASELTGEAKATAETPLPPGIVLAESPSSDSSSSDASDSDADKRRRAEGYKRSLAAAEAYVREAEAELAAAEDHWHFVNSHTNQSAPLSEARNRLERAKSRVQEFRRQRDQITDAARREGIPPGWLR